MYIEILGFCWRRLTRKMREYEETPTKKHPDISRDLKADILSKLPPKILCKFKCVSKQWLDIITDPCFLNMHRIRFMQNSPLLLHSSTLFQDERNTDQYILYLTTMDKNGSFCGEFNDVIRGWFCVLVSCCNLICLVTTKQIYICNPSIQHLLRFPVSSHLPVTNEGAVGFGYLPAINTYKIVHIYSCTVRNECEVFTLTDGAGGNWRWIGECPYPVFHDKSPVCVDGAIYWIAWDRKVRPANKKILAFDMEKESLHLISYPSFTNEPRFEKFEKLVQLKGCLCLIYWRISFPRKGWEIWKLKEETKHIWIREYVIDFSLFDNNYDYIHLSTPLDEQDGEILMNSDEDCLCYYNIQRKYFRRRPIKFNSVGYNRTVCLYFDGLFSLKS